MEDLVATTRRVKARSNELLSKNSKHTCLYPNCSQKAISSHSISQSILKNISQNGHVVGPVFNRNDIGKNFEDCLSHTKSNLQVKPIGLKKASTFNGFCGEHDNSIFCSLDNAGIVTYRDIFLQLYRTACRFRFVHGITSQSEIEEQGFEYHSNTEFEEGMHLSLQNFVLFFNDLLTDFKELEHPINIGFSETLRTTPYSENIPLEIEVIYKKTSVRYPVALQKDFTLHFDGSFHHCLVVVLPHAEYSSLIIACHPSVVPKFGNFISKGDLGLLRLIESVIMSDSDFYMAPDIHDRWSDKKKEIISDDFYFFNERKFLEEYDVSIFDDIRAGLLSSLTEEDIKTEQQRMDALPLRPSFEERDHKLTYFTLQDRHKKLNVTGNKTGRCYPIGAVQIDDNC